MENNFVLSEKMMKAIYTHGKIDNAIFLLTDVKEAVKRLKSYFANKDEAYINEVIDKVFGPKLT